MTDIKEKRLVNQINDSKVSKSNKRDWNPVKNNEGCSMMKESSEDDSDSPFNCDSDEYFSEKIQSCSVNSGHNKKDNHVKDKKITEDTTTNSRELEKETSNRASKLRKVGVCETSVGGRKSERLKSRTPFCTKKYEAQILKRLTKMLKKDPTEFTTEEYTTFKSFPDLIPVAQKRLQKRRVAIERMQEIEDPTELLDAKCTQLAKAINEAKYLVVYTGAGISTSAQIPDYRGPNGIWTMLQKGQSLDSLTDSPQVLSTADPTVTHLTLTELHRRGIAKHIVSQNCDGLHLRSGIPKTSLSEVHGNMYIEVCSKCNREYVRSFDVTENTRRYEHRTGRNCYNCGSQLRDTVVHFGERGSLRWPLNWAGAEYHVDKADTILCLGSSLKVLRRYPWLWCMDKPANKRPKLLIVNLQWTPKDQFASLKIHGKCDDVMCKVMQKLKFQIPPYCRHTDAIFTIFTPLHPSEAFSKSATELSFPENAALPIRITDLNNYIRFEPIFREQVCITENVNEEDSAKCEEDGEGKKGKRILKGKGIGWLGNAWGAKPKKRKLKLVKY